MDGFIIFMASIAICIIALILYIRLTITKNGMYAVLSDNNILDIMEGGFVKGGLTENEDKQKEKEKKALEDVFNGTSTTSGDGKGRKKFYEGDANWKFTDTNSNRDCWTEWDYLRRSETGEDILLKENIFKTFTREDGREWCPVNYYTGEIERRENDKPSTLMDIVNEKTGNIWGLVGAIGLGLTEEIMLTAMKRSSAKAATLAAKKVSAETSEKLIKKVGKEVQEEAGEKLFKESGEKIAKEAGERTQREIGEATFKKGQKKILKEFNEEVSQKISNVLRREMGEKGIAAFKKKILSEYGTKGISSLKDDFVKKVFSSIKTSVDSIASKKIGSLVRYKAGFLAGDLSRKGIIKTLAGNINKKVIDASLKEAQSMIYSSLYKKVLSAFRTISDNVAKLSTRLIWKLYSVKLKAVIALKTFFRSQAKTFLSIGKALVKNSDNMAKMSLSLAKMGSTISKSAIKNGFKLTMKGLSKMWIKMRPGPLALFDMMSFAMDMADVGGFNAYISTEDFKKQVEKSNTAARNNFVENVKKSEWYKDSDIKAEDIDYPRVLDPTVDTTLEELEDMISEKYSIIFKLADLGERHSIISEFFSTLESDLESKKLLPADLEDDEKMKKYNDLVKIDELETVVRIDMCKKVGGLLYGENNLCTYTKEQCNNLYKWPLSDDRKDDVYAEFRDGVCVEGNHEVRYICENAKAEWDVENNKCKMDKKWCLRMGAEYNSSTEVCSIPMSQEAIEFIFGTSVTRLYKQALNAGVRPGIELIGTLLDPPTEAEYVGEIKNTKANKCFNINTSSFPYKVELTSCDGGDRQKFYYNPNTGLIVADNMKYRNRYLCMERPFSTGDTPYMNYCDNSSSGEQQWDVDTVNNLISHKKTKAALFVNSSQNVSIKDNYNPSADEKKLVFGVVRKRNQAEFNKRIAAGVMNAATFGQIDWSPVVMSGSTLINLLIKVGDVIKSTAEAFVDECGLYGFNNDSIIQKTVATTSSQSTASVPEDTKTYCGEFKIRDKCMDIADGNIKEGAAIQIWDCNDSKAQKFIYFPSDNTIRPAANKEFCFDVNDGNGGTKLQLWGCNGTNAQKFKYIADEKRIQWKPDTSKCLDLIGDNSNNATRFQILGCKDHRAQQYSASSCTESAVDKLVSNVSQAAVSVGKSVCSSMFGWMGVC